jgi:TolB-like protein/DNA-binding winged helix-turn-helix (wHTH) protein
MANPPAKPVIVGDWHVDPLRGEMSRGGEIVRLDGRTMRLLAYLAGRSGEVVSVPELLDHVWSGVVVTSDSVYQAIASLRRLLGDDARQPAYIVTVPRLGYRLIANVIDAVDPSPAGPTSTESPAGPSSPAAAPDGHGAPPPAMRPHFKRPRRWLTAGAVLLCLVSALALGLRHQVQSAGRIAASSVPAASVGVLPFLDLTSQSMEKEYFADSMTEELVDRLSRIPGLHVPSATSSFYLKGKDFTVAEAASSLRVSYVLDGSVRQSDSVLRISARLVRAGDGYVVWSGTYDRPFSDQLKTQDDIAGEVAKALQTVMRR